MTDKTQKEKEEEQQKGVPGILSSILGFAGPIAGFIPSLLKGPQEDFLKKQQAGGGAGAAMARQTASEAARRVIGASTAQPSSGRGGALREGLRAADAIVQRGAQQAAITGARESQAATQQLRQNQLLRRGAAAKFGAGVGQGLSGIAATLASARDQGPVQTEPLQAGQPVLGEDPTGLGGQAGIPGELGVNQQDFQDQLTRMQAMRQPVGPPATPEQLFPQQPAEQSVVGDQLAQPTKPQAAIAPEEALRGVQEAANPLAAEAGAIAGLAEETAKRQDAELGYMMTASTPEAEAFRAMRKQQEEWLYYQAMNYDPALTGSAMGIDPQRAATLLEGGGFEVDRERLGIGTGDVER